ncbi:MAG: hypothetical protein KBT03_07175 [Bacteroidales bacterium]|nr:hypothetical protein [Candidatus Scybalousia scybalohippi]
MGSFLIILNDVIGKIGLFIYKNWKPVLVSSIFIILLFFTISYKHQRDSAVENLEKHKAEIKEVNERIIKEKKELVEQHKELEERLQEKFDENLKVKDEQIKNLNDALLNYRSTNDSLLKKIDNRTTSIVTNNSSTKEDFVRYVNILSKLYGEALKDGAESSEAIERLKPHYQQCISDFNSLYNEVENYNHNIEQIKNTKEK